MANLLQETTDRISQLSDRVAASAQAVDDALDAVAGLTAFIPGISTVRTDLADLIASLSQGIATLDLELESIVRGFGVPDQHVDTVVEFMELASSLASLSQLLATQIDSTIADTVTEKLEKIGDLVDLVDTVEGFTTGIRTQLVQSLNDIEAPIRGS
jgi:hypothetical protein